MSFAPKNSAPEFWQMRSYVAWLLFPFSLLFRAIARVRRVAYQTGLKNSWRSPVPVIVVGNISVGGAGKTPLVIAFARRLSERGIVVGIVCRGYGGVGTKWPVVVNPNTDALLVGDEAVLLAKRSEVPVVAGPDRAAAVRSLLLESNCSVALSDDGLQHYALQRDLEIVVVNGDTEFGNGFCLPAGPLREPVGRLSQADLIVYSGLQRRYPGYQLTFGDRLCHVGTDQQMPIADFQAQSVHAVAAIANPVRFFETLRELGLTVIEHPLPDHHQYTIEELDFGDGHAVVMTEKDSVKCSGFDLQNCWYLPATAIVDEEILAPFDQHVSRLLQRKGSVKNSHKEVADAL